MVNSELISVGMEPAPVVKNFVKEARERVRNRVGAHVEDELAKSTITLGITSSEQENKHLEELGTFLDLQVFFALTGALAAM